MSSRRVILAGLLLAACTVEHGAVRLQSEWPERAPSYGTAYDRWTRHESARRDLMTVIDAYATLKSVEWRAAYVTETARRLELSEDAAAELAAAELAAAEKAWEVELIVATQAHTWQDFQKGARSMWRVALVTEDGREVLPTSVLPDPRPRAELEVFWPDMTGFHKAYVVTFPKVGTDGRPLVPAQGGRLTLRIASAQGRVEMVWKGK